MTQENKDVDKGWAWVVLIASVFGQIIAGMTAASVGVFQAEFLVHFSDSSNTFISLVASVAISLQLTLGPLAGLLCNIFGIRIAMMAGGIIFSVGLFLSSFATSVDYLLATFSVITGAGFGLTYTPLNIAPGLYFHKKRALANGLTTGACGIGVSLGSSVVVWLIDSHGWRFTMSVLASLALQNVVIGCLYFPLTKQRRYCCKPQSEVKNDKEVKQESCLWFFGHPHWWILCMSYGISMIGFAIHLVHFPSYALSCGITKGQLSTVLASFGIVLSVSRLLAGFFCNDTSVDLLVFMFSTQGIYGLLVLFMPFYATTFNSLMIFQVSMSLFYSASMVPLTPFSVQLFGVKKLATVFGWVMLWGGLGYLVGPVIAGAIYDVSGSYFLGFNVGGMAITGSAFLLLLIPLIKVKVVEPEPSENMKFLMHEDQTITIENTKNSNQLLSTI